MNKFLKGEKIVDQGLGLLLRELILPRLVYRYAEADFAGAKNDTLTIRIPSLLKGREYEFRTRNNAIVTDDLNEVSIAVKLDKHAYNAVGITDEEMTLDIKSWGEQVARPQTRAVGELLESYVAAVMEDADTKYTATYTQGDPDDANDRSFQRMLNRARKRLNEENVPAAGRVVILGADVEEAALNTPQLNKANEAGTDSALRESVLGRLSGFNIIGNVNSVPADFAMAFHPTAFALGNVAPVVPDGAKAGAREDHDGLAMRWIRDYDSDHLRDRSVYSAFAGTASIEDGRDLDTESEDFGELIGKNVRAVGIEFEPFEAIGS